MIKKLMQSYIFVLKKKSIKNFELFETGSFINMKN